MSQRKFELLFNFFFFFKKLSKALKNIKLKNIDIYKGKTKNNYYNNCYMLR